MNKNIPIEMTNRTILEALANDNVKTAADAATDYTRTQLREDSFAFKILPPEQITPDNLDRDIDERNRVICELEPDSPGSKWCALQDVPEGEYIVGSRYVIPFALVLTRKYTKTIQELYTYRQDIRKILTDNSIKDGLATIDGKFTEMVDGICTDAPGPGQPHNFTGKVQWREFAGFTRENLATAQTMLTKGNAQGKFRLKNYLMLMNDTTSRELLKFDHDEWGGAPKDGPSAADNMIHGLTTDTIMGLKAIYTIKDDLIPDGVIYYFASPEFLGHTFYIDDWTMWMKKEAYFISMFSYWYGGMGIGNIAGVAKAVFKP